MHAGRVLAGALLLTAFLAGSAYCQEDQGKKSVLYQWTDGKGIAHITDDPAKVPAKYRSSTVQLESPEEGEGGQPGAISPGRAPEPAGRGEIAPSEDYRKSMWQSRMREAQDRLADLEARYKDLEKERDEAMQNWGGPSAGRFMAEAQADQRVKEIEAQMQEVRKQIDDARREVEDVIPDEARKAGVPPGWLRE